jgi:uncharacterized protein (DUF1778 family)
MDPSLSTVLQTLRIQQAELRALGVSHASAFGSVARGEAATCKRNLFVTGWGEVFVRRRSRPPSLTKTGQWPYNNKMVEYSASAPRQRDQRLEARVTPGQKELIERAAYVQGRTVTDFMITALQDAAQRVIEESAAWKLSRQQQKTFVEALMNPPAPNQNLRVAYQRYKEFQARSRRGR